MGKIYLLSNQNYDGVENLEVFKINYLPSNIDLNKYDALIITSKNAIYSLDSFNKDWKNIPCYAIASKTAKVITELNGIVKFIGSSGHGDDFAEELTPLLKNKKVLYLRAKKVVSNLVEKLKKNNIDVDEEVIYETVCNNNLKQDIERDSTIIFTSPSSINCFFENYDWHDSFKAIVIGKTTASYLPDNIKYKISSTTSIQECIKLAQMDTF